MRLKLQCVVGIALALFFSPDIYAQGDVSSLSGREFKIQFSFYICTKPDKVHCVCTSEEEKKTCPACEEWTKQEKNFTSHLALKPDAYSYKTGPPRANVFVNDAAGQVYGKGLPKSDVGHPITLNELYKDPQKYGWIEVPPDQQKTGAIAIWPSVGGVVVSDTSQEPRNEMRTVQVLYPSDKKDGQLNQNDAKFIDPEAKPKYIVPFQATDSRKQGTSK